MALRLAFCLYARVLIDEERKGGLVRDKSCLSDCMMNESDTSFITIGRATAKLSVPRFHLLLR